MKVLVAYMSQTGNTKKVAEAILGEIQVEKDLREIKELDGLQGYDLYFVGCPIQFYGPAHPAKVFLEKHASGKDIALFVTHAAREDSEHLPPWLDACRAVADGANLVGFFNCRGELDEKVADFMNFMNKSNDPNLSAWTGMRDETVGQPCATRLERARVFAREIMEKYSG